MLAAQILGLGLTFSNFTGSIYSWLWSHVTTILLHALHACFASMGSKLHIIIVGHPIKQPLLRSLSTARQEEFNLKDDLYLLKKGFSESIFHRPLNMQTKSLLFLPKNYLFDLPLRNKFHRMNLRKFIRLGVF